MFALRQTDDRAFFADTRLAVAGVLGFLHVRDGRKILPFLRISIVQIILSGGNIADVGDARRAPAE
jgi:hypothetical protein